MRDLAKQLIEAKQLLTRQDEKTWQGGTVFVIDLRKDRFVHFTQLDRAKQILAAGKLLMRPPYEKFGIDAVTAVSLVYGANVPKVQTTHSKGKLVAIEFSTTTKPKSGHVEEVIWDRDVVLKNAKVIMVKKATSMLSKTPEQIGDQDMVEYR